MDEAYEGDGPPIEAGRDTPEVFELVETSLNGVSNFVGLEVVGDLMLARRIAGDHWLGPHLADQGAQGIGIIRLIGQNALWRQVDQQVGGNRSIAALARPQDHT